VCARDKPSLTAEQVSDLKRRPKARASKAGPTREFRISRATVHRYLN